MASLFKDLVIKDCDFHLAGPFSWYLVSGSSEVLSLNNQVWRPTWQGSESSLQSPALKGMETLNPTALKKLNLANNYVSLKAHPFPFELLDEITVLATTLIAASVKQRPS